MAWRCRFLTARPSQDGRVIAEKRLSEELSGAPDALDDFHTGRVLAVTRHLRYPTMVQTRDDLEESRSLFLMRVSSEISAKLALIALPDDDGMRSPGSRARTLSV